MIIKSLVTLSASVLVFSPLTTAIAAPQAPQSIVMKNAKGAEVGTATLTPMAKGVRISLDLKDLPPGEHAFHVHETGKCEGPKFDTAGGHFAPTKNPHGFDDASGPHAGDMPNLIVGGDGKLKTEVINTTVTLSGGGNALTKKGGTALMIHEKADDYKSQPAGNAGARIACGEIKGG